MRDPDDEGVLSPEPNTELTSLFQKEIAVLCYAPHPYPFIDMLQEEDARAYCVEREIQLVDTVTNTAVTMKTLNDHYVFINFEF